MISKSDLENNLTRAQEWIKAADQKVGIFLAFQGIIFTILFEKTFLWIKDNLTNMNLISMCLLSSAIVLITYSIYKSTSAIMPRLVKESKNKSIIYFGDIAKFSISDFQKTIHEIDQEGFENEIINQTHICSKIAIKKHLQFRDAILAFFAGLFLFIVTFLI
jgi:multisubunit Na+/H+ antiporter MnhC subunit